MKFKIDSKRERWLIPLLSLLVIFESVLVIQKLNQKQIYQDRAGGPVEPTGPAISLNFSGTNNVVVGQEGEVRVMMKTLRDVSLDGADLLLNYDPDLVEIIGTEAAERFSYLARNWIQPDKKRILVSMVESAAPDGVSFFESEEIVLLTIRYLARAPGVAVFGVFTDEAGVGTVFAENSTSLRLPFSRENFSVQLR
ncbi:MAG: hypothetical protein ABH867_01660 [Patescibacteria group bacterium]|nr:hypothetical protein [Patescibacteria group bacterium]